MAEIYITPEAITFANKIYEALREKKYVSEASFDLMIKQLEQWKTEK